MCMVCLYGGGFKNESGVLMCVCECVCTPVLDMLVCVCVQVFVVHVCFVCCTCFVRVCMCGVFV